MQFVLKIDIPEDVEDHPIHEGRRIEMPSFDGLSWKWLEKCVESVYNDLGNPARMVLCRKAALRRSVRYRLACGSYKGPWTRNSCETSKLRRIDFRAVNQTSVSYTELRLARLRRAVRWLWLHSYLTAFGRKH